ncbi:hypothetical protein GUJ93_ZPchr0008g12207 [Zizania palustris]|uniref:Uncharacterized protein n=1 Tax=Zizania palustris TaxID=103762 RepID=A0A8J5RIB8_ZIZPA|nr:hypothetical protein GUJ93_ZPchr0008g12207 [Zizania palustris]
MEDLQAMMQKIGYLSQPEFEGIKFSVGAERHWREHESRKEVEAQGEKLRRLERELQASKRQVVEQQWRILHLESQEETRECTVVAPAPVPASAPQRDQPMGEDIKDPMEEEFFEESRTEEPLLGYTPAS